MNDLPQLPDFLTLYKSDAVDDTPTNLQFKWNIPDSYYSNDRTSTCYVTLVSVAISGTGLTGQQYACVLKDGGSNYSSTKNSGIVLGFVQNNTATNNLEHHPTGGILQPLIKSNPQTLTIEFTDLAGTVQDVNTGEFVLSLRFDYISPISQAAGMEGTFQPNLLR